jgi:hypothetical protein
LDWYDSVFEVIDMRSFSNLWYWIGLAVFWSTVSHWVLGVPFDSVLRAKRGKPETAMEDLQDHVRVNINRILYIAEVSGSWIALFGSAFMTALAIAAFLYNIEFAQAAILLLGPLTLLSLLTVRAARSISEQKLKGAELIAALVRHRFVTQGIGVVAIFFTAMYGMWVNLYVGPFG